MGLKEPKSLFKIVKVRDRGMKISYVFSRKVSGHAIGTEEKYEITRHLR